MGDYEICGNISVKRNCRAFTLKCFFCNFAIEISKWHQFVVHFRDNHSYSKSVYSKNKDDVLNEKDNNDSIEEFEQKAEENIEYIDFLKVEEDEEHFISTIKKDVNDDGLNSEEEFMDLNTDEPEYTYPKDDFLHNQDDGDDDAEYEIPDSIDNESDSEDLSLNMDTDKLSSDEDRKSDDSYKYRTVKFKPTFYRQNSRTSTFIKLYKTNPCLWNPNDTNYRNKVMQSIAYQNIIQDMLLKEKVTLNERTLKFALKHLHDLYETTKRTLKRATQRTQVVLLSHYKSCKFLENTVDPFTKEMEDPENEEAASKLKISFSTKNELITNLIDLYSGLPQLYDPQHIDFTNAAIRKEAYETITAELQTNEERDICSNDIVVAIQDLRRLYYKTKKYIADESNSGDGGVSNTELFYFQKCHFLQSKTFQQRLPCELCEKVFTSDFALQSHLYNEHGVGELPYKCLLCDRNFEKRCDLMIHKQRVHIGKVHSCSTCGRSFAVLADLKIHNLTHTGVKRFICESCGKAFRKKSQLSQHTNRMHTKIRAFKCDLCPKSFFKNVDLRDHVKAHLNIRDKICETCGKGFTNCHSLIRHRQIHSAVKKFACKLCSARFSQFVGLNSHMKRTHNLLRGPPKDAEGSTTMEGSLL